MQDEGLDEETISLLTKNHIAAENMQYLTHEKLEAIGVKSWGKRMAILTAAKRFYEYFGITLAQQQFKQGIPRIY